MKSKSNFIILIVTYGDRLEILKKTLIHILDNFSFPIVLIENNIEKSTSDFLRSINKVNLKLISSNENLGSAGGYSKGLKYIRSNFSSVERILLLDDDNFISVDGIKKILKVNQNQNELLVCNSVKRNDIFVNKCSKNNFLGLNIFKRKNNVLKCAPYGGLVLPIKVLSDVGFPREDMFLYGDDHEYTYRIFQSGFKLKFCKEIHIIDLIFSHEKRSTVHRYFQDEFEENLLYYQIKNHTYLSCLQKNNHLLFYFNLCLFLIVIFYANFKIRFYNAKRWKIIFRAIIDGFKTEKN